MPQSFKNIHIGSLIHSRVKECDIEYSRICNFFNCTEEEIEKVYNQNSLDSDLILKWSKLLEYDFFRLYSQHLILYAPQGNIQYNRILKNNNKSSLPQFRKNIYNREIIDFILELIEKNKKTKNEIIKEYRIPKTTLYKWLAKYKRNS
ncbi:MULTISPECIES: transposase [unclassified Chryseobacterium]|uniref:transposase n=1 Tax=unclassified Chryseobacterium TaxID=2593645 RepID=UPI00300FAE8E